MENKFSIPLAIVIAGLLISGSLYITRDGARTGDLPAQAGSAVTEEIPLRPLGESDHVLGSPDADVIIYEFSDTECPFCKQFHNTLHRVIDTYGKNSEVAWVYRHFPIDQLHSKARNEAEATECAAELGGNAGFWKYIDRLYEITPSNDGLDSAKLPEIATYAGLDAAAFVRCLESGKYSEKVEQHFREATEALGRGTPHSVLVFKKPLNNKALDILQTAAAELPSRTLIISPDEKMLVVSGSLPFDFLKLIIDASLGKETP